MTIKGPEHSDQKDLVIQVPSGKTFDWLSTIQFIFSIFAALLYLGTAIIGVFFIALGNISQAAILPENQLLSSYLFLAGLGFSGILMIPSVVYSGKILFGRNPTKSVFHNRFTYITGIFPVLILVGYLVQTGPSWAAFLLPLLHPLANAAAIFWGLFLVYRMIDLGKPRRFWGSFGSGLTIVPLIAFIIESIILVALGILWIIMLSSQPEMRQELMELARHMQSDSVNPELLESSMIRFISQPGIAATAALYIAVIIPLVEEFLKPVVLWFTLGRKLTPGEGFLIGAASGAGYALFENLTIGAVADVWTFVTITRLGTACIHIITAGLVGWGFASAMTDRKYFRLIGAYLTAVILHGVWNGLNILNALVDLPSASEVLSGFVFRLAEYAPAGLIILAIGSFGGLIYANSWLQRAIITQSTEKSEV